jgi:AcrR family transcriptional regulator
MKHLTSPPEGESEAQVKVPTRRALAKQQTRTKVLSAARQLFSEQGYEGATIRDIAAAAGMSTGAVFASFADKSDLFREILFSDIEALGRTMREASATTANSAEERLLNIFAAGYGFYQNHLPLARAAFSVSWSDETENGRLGSTPAVVELRRLIKEQLEKGVASGEFRSDGEEVLRTEMLFDCYLANYRQAIYYDWSLDALKDRSRGQIAVILAGVRGD